MMTYMLKTFLKDIIYFDIDNWDIDQKKPEAIVTNSRNRV